MINSDLLRSFRHFKRHEELGHLKLNLIHKIFLSIVFFILLPFCLLNLFFKNDNKNRKKIFILKYKEEEPYTTIYKLIRQEKIFNFIQLPKLFIPLLPRVFIKDISQTFIVQPMFIFKNLAFFGALILKISKYYYMVKYHKVSNLIVFQEYSFYMSYFTRVMELEGGKLYNIQHGIPGDTYCWFRFSKCFVWGEFYKDVYINNKAEKTQFVISGSILHSYIEKKLKQKEVDTDILYVMQGKSEEMKDVLDVLEDLARNKVVRYIQHPRHPVRMNNDILIESNDDILNAIGRSKIIISHYSTTLLDACVLEKHALSYTKMEKNLSKYVSYLDKENIIHTKEDLIKRIGEQGNKVSILSERYISNDLEAIQVIKKVIVK